MTFTYSSSRATVAKWYWRSLRRNKRHFVAWLLWLALAFFMGYTWSGVAGVRGNQQMVAGAVTVLGVAAILALYPQLRFKPQTRTLTLLQDGIATSIGSRHESYPWSDIADVERDGGFLVITCRNFNAFLVPSSAVGPDLTLDSVIAQCLAWRSSESPRSTV